MAKAMRDRFTQAVLPVSHKIVRGLGTELDTVLGNMDFVGLVGAFGIGIGIASMPEAEVFQMERLRYGRIILVTDE
jgi:DNA gyrase/topoisomerase IV subunit B